MLRETRAALGGTRHHRRGRRCELRRGNDYSRSLDTREPATSPITPSG
jgi:hypothetical protein